MRPVIQRAIGHALADHALAVCRLVAMTMTDKI